MELKPKPRQEREKERKRKMYVGVHMTKRKRRGRGHRRTTQKHPEKMHLFYFRGEQIKAGKRLILICD